jgi:hypothetical protein
VTQSKFAVLNIMPRNIFGELMGFFPQGLNPLKIHGRYKLEFVPKFIT